ncbi:MAG: S8 family serine peptidase, partial [Parasporobacterium sp.]|nr:S8 family serine peptidase [Parasporobacterium sp.]
MRTSISIQRMLSLILAGVILALVICSPVFSGESEVPEETENMAVTASEETSDPEYAPGGFSEELPQEIMEAVQEVIPGEAEELPEELLVQLQEALSEENAEESEEEFAEGSVKELSGEPAEEIIEEQSVEFPEEESDEWPEEFPEGFEEEQYTEPYEAIELEEEAEPEEITDSEEAEEPNEITDPEEAAEPGEIIDAEEDAESEEPLEPEETAVEEDPAEAAADPYADSLYDAAAFYDLDFSSGRLIVGTYDPSIFSDPEVILSELNGLYLLQFSDVQTAQKAYAYYLSRAELVEIDSRSLSVDSEEYLIEEIAAEEVMTGAENPFSEMEEAVAETGWSNEYDVALIDTGTNGYATAAVSMIGDYTGDENGHGTLMAERIAEQHPDARILSIKAFESNGLADLSAVYAAFQYALTQNVRVILISASAIMTADSMLLRSAIAEALSYGILVVTSAGNNGRDASWYVPGNYDGVLTIGACDAEGKRQPFSNYGPVVNYNVAADSTSEAAARMAGWLSAHSRDEIENVRNQGLIFDPEYSGQGPEETSETPLEEFCAILADPGTREAIMEFVSSLDPADAQDLYLLLDEDQRYEMLQIFIRDEETEYSYPESTGAAMDRIAALFYLDSFHVDTKTNGEVTVYEDNELGLRTHQIGEFKVTDPYTGEQVWQIASIYGVTTPSGSFHAFCAEATSDWPVNSSGNSQIMANDMKTMIYLLSPAGPLYGEYDFSDQLSYLKVNGFGSSAEETYKDYALCHCMISGLYSGDWGPWSEYSISLMQSCINDIETWLAGNSLWQEYYNNAVSYAVHFGGFSYTPEGQATRTIDVQDVFWVETAAYGNVKFACRMTSDNTLSVTKVLEGGNTADYFEFQLQINGRAGAGYAYTGSRSGTTDANGRFSLKGGESIMITGIPAGASYKVTESDAGGYTTAVTDPSGQERQTYEVSGTFPAAGSGKSFVITGLTELSYDYQVFNSLDASGTAAASGQITNGGTITLASGQSAVLYKVPQGTEVSVNDGNGTVKTGTIVPAATVDAGQFSYTDSDRQQVLFRNSRLTGSLQIEKILDTEGLSSAAIEIIKKSDAYSVAGAQYTVYTDAKCTKKYGSEVLTITAAESADGSGMSGSSNVIRNVPFGTYYLKETKAGKNLKMDSTIYSVTISADNYSTTQKPSAKSKDVPVLGSLQIEKILDTEGLSSAAIEIIKKSDAYSVAGAQYTVYT